jgi:general stress protein CsbA
MRTYLLLGDNPLAWQVFAYLLRMAGAIGFFLLLRQIWPKMRLFTTTAALLFIMYPGFLQEPNAVVFSNQLISYALAIYSILFTVVALRTHNKYVAIITTAIALLCEIAYPTIHEYLIGLEGLRVILIWYLTPILKKSLKTKLARVLLRWVPYLLPLGGFLFWRIYIFKSTRPTTDVLRLLGLYTSSTFAMTQKVVLGTLKDFFNATFFAWAVPPYQLITTTRDRDLIVGLALALLASGLFWLFYHWARKTALGALEESGESQGIVWIGLISVFCTIIPVTIANRNIGFLVGSVNDRYTLHTTVGVILLTVGIIYLLVKNRGRLWLPVGLLFLSVLTQYSNAVYFRDVWETQQQLWWQLAWRAPQFEEGTVLMVNLPSDVYSYAEDYEIWAPANIIYNSIPNTLRIYSEVLYAGTAPLLVHGEKEHRFIRNIQFDRDYTHALIVSMPSTSSCVHVIDGDKLNLSPAESPLINWVAPYSHIQQIETDVTPSQPPEIIFGQEPPHTWCYYYQKMSLAQQRRDWDQVIALGEEAIRAHLEPNDRVEWMPLIEAYAYSGELEQAENIILKLYGIPNLRENLCMYSLLQRDNPNLALPEEGMNFLTDRLCNSDWKKP